MVVVQINATCGIGSTGKICESISKLSFDSGIENYVLYNEISNGYSYGIKYGCSKVIQKKEALKSRILGNWGFNSVKSTKKLINLLERINPDIIHIHNIHDHGCDIELLFNYILDKKIKLFWTFHDCWSFTGYCTHYAMIGCDKWKTKCSKCQLKKEYSWFFDKSEILFEKKKKIFESIDMTIFTPSNWLASQLNESFLKNKPIHVINNGIDLNVFKKRNTEFKRKYKIDDKFVILGVAFNWSYKKGVDVFIRLASELDESYRIVMVGVDKKLKKELPDNIISIEKTASQDELSEIYNSSDLFLNPTREDTFPTVNMEALACGIPVITFNTGGSPEIIDQKTGIVIEQDNINVLIETIIDLAKKNMFNENDCINKARKDFDMNKSYEKYVHYYINELEQ